MDTFCLLHRPRRLKERLMVCLQEAAVDGFFQHVIKPIYHSDTLLAHPWWERSSKCSWGRRSDRRWIQSADVTRLWPVCHSAMLASPSGIWTRRLFHLHYRCLCAAGPTPLSLSGNLWTWVHAYKKRPRLVAFGGTNWRLICCCHPAGWPVASGQKWGLEPFCRLDVLLIKKRKEKHLNVFLSYISGA